MAKSTRTRTSKTVSKVGSHQKSGKKASNPQFCNMKPPRRDLPAGLATDRLDAIFEHDKKWANGTNLRYYFFHQKEDGEHLLMTDGSIDFVSYVGPEPQREVVRSAFKIWAEVGLGVGFEEVDNREDAEIRIGFMRGDGAWSYLGRDVLGFGANQRTMNFGWHLVGQDGLDTALHEIGHTLGMPHEHQNPKAGIVWDEPKVIAALAGDPNFWDEATTRRNIIDKISQNTVTGSAWDRNSIMHYPFPAGLILRPEGFDKLPLQPEPGLSVRDKAWIKLTYPPLDEADHETMKPFVSVPLRLSPGQQFDGVFEPRETRRYTIQTFGEMDTVLTLFEDVGDGARQFLAGDDDSGHDTNAKVDLRMIKGRRYFVRMRLFFSWDEGNMAIMIT